jgi:hypothetical protein
MDRYRGSAIPATRPLNGSAMQTGAFPHTEEAERERGRQKFGIETLAIITDAQGEPVGIGLDGYCQSCGIGVANDVGEDFL